MALTATPTFCKGAGESTSNTESIGAYLNVGKFLVCTQKWTKLAVLQTQVKSDSLSKVTGLVHRVCLKFGEVSKTKSSLSSEYRLPQFKNN